MKKCIIFIVFAVSLIISVNAKPVDNYDNSLFSTSNQVCIFVHYEYPPKATQEDIEAAAIAGAEIYDIRGKFHGVTSEAGLWCAVGLPLGVYIVTDRSTFTQKVNHNVAGNVTYDITIYE